MERYSSYKDSGISWIGDIPSHWNVIKLNHIFYHNTGKTLNSNLKGNNHPYLTTSNVYNGYFDLSILKEMPFLDDEIERYSVTAGDLLVCEGGDIGRCNIWKENYSICYQNHLHRLRAKIDIKVEYYSFLINHIKSLGIFDNMGKGIAIKGLSAATLGNTRLLLPPLAEQEKIVSYLENKTSKIDAYVADKEKEIELLQELKQKTIADAVTKGLNPDAKMKDSKTSLFGQIPAHWEERKMKYCFNERSEKNHPEEPVLCATQSQGVIPQSLYQNRVVVVNKGFEGLKFVKVGDFVISLRSFEGGIEYAYYQGIISAAYTILTPRKAECADYFKLLFKCYPFIQVLQTCVTGIREGQNINYQMLGRKYIPLPPLDEQRAIVSYIEEKYQKIDSLTTELQAEIDHLKEYKQRLIADVVTGQVNVQNH